VPRPGVGSGGEAAAGRAGDTDQASVCDGLGDILNDACLDLVAAGRLEREQYERFTIPVYFRTLDELLAPLGREGSPVRGAFAVDRAEALDTPAPFVVEFRRGGDLAAYAEAYTGFLRAVTEPVVRAALDQPEGEDGAVDCLYECIRTRLIADPERYAWRYTLVAALLTRR
jgi:cyclopropane-fatty-acyl-phospholipid synthase